MSNLIVELLVEELPPKVLEQLGEAFGQVLAASLHDQGLVADPAGRTVYATPRRLAVHVRDVADKASDRAQSYKLMPVSVGLDGAGEATPALRKKLQALGASGLDVSSLRRTLDGKSETLFLDSTVAGIALADGLQKALTAAIVALPIPKVMAYQLESNCELPGWSTVSFVRPAHGLLALHGGNVVPVQALGLKAGNTTQGHRFEASASPLVIPSADAYVTTLERDGAVVPGFAQRRAEIERQIALACAHVGGGARVAPDAALLDEVTGLVERPNVLVCTFEQQFLEVPQECLILTMKANQKYFPLLDATGRLTNRFLVVSNISPVDTSAVVGGNERVVRPRLADAKFFFDQDRKKTLQSRVAGLDKVVYHHKLGTQGERSKRVTAIAQSIGALLGGDVLETQAEQAASLAKADLLTDMVGEFPELQGVMGRHYAINDGLSSQVAEAIEDHYKPRFSGDDLPRDRVGLVVALADKLETLVGLFGVGQIPTGDKDPYALRRHALGVIRILVEGDLDLNLIGLLDRVLLSSDALDLSGDPKKILWIRMGIDGPVLIELAPDTSGKVVGFIFDRMGVNLRDQGFSAQEVDAVLSLRPPRLRDVPKRLAAVRSFVALKEAPALAAANKRIGNILKKAPEAVARVSQALLQAPAEVALFATMQAVLPKANAQFDAGDYTASLQSLAALATPVDAFFEGVMVNAPESELRLNRQGLLQSLHDAMNRVADLSRLAS